MTSLRRNFSWTLFGNVTYSACQWLVIVIIAKLGSPAMLGQFTLGVALCAPIMLLCGMSLRVVLATDVARKFPFGTYLGLRLITTATALLIVGGVIVANRYPLDTTVVVSMIAAAKAAEALSEVFWGQFQQQERMATVARSMIIKGVLSVIAVTALLATTGSLQTACVGFAAAWFVTLLVFDVPTGRLTFDQPMAPQFKRPSLRQLGRSALPLGIVMMLASFANNVPRYFISHHEGDAELGIFSAIANLMIAGHTVFTALGQVTIPKLTRLYVARDRAGYLRLLRLLCLVSVSLGLAGILVAVVAGKPLLTLLYTEEYASSVDILILTMAAGLGAYLVSAAGVALVSAGQFSTPLPLQAFNLVIVTLGCALLVPRLGALGAAWVIVAANLATMLMFAWRVGLLLERFSTEKT
jgi:O-antigen/teichoic acid export membrane protein